MPTYDYACESCGVMELIHSIHDPAVKKCPKCGSRAFARQVAMNVHFISAKDEGWQLENNGKGRYIGGLGKRDDPQAYCRSLNEAVEKAKKAGKSYEIG
jgi:putative FmdB family regulatory protein